MAKAAERLSLLRDLAAEVLFERIGAEQATIDPKVLLDTVVKLGAQVERLEGRATGRTESTVKTEERAAVIREQLTATIDDLAAKRAQRGAGDVSEAVDA